MQDVVCLCFSTPESHVIPQITGKFARRVPPASGFSSKSGKRGVDRLHDGPIDERRKAVKVRFFDLDVEVEHVPPTGWRNPRRNQDP
jgi:hypothetical protein